MKDNDEKKAGLRLILNNLATSTPPTVEETIAYAREKHSGQTDHNGKPYAKHPIRTAQNVLLLAPDASEDVIKAALLHDVIEDCDDVDENTLKALGYSEETLEILKLVNRPPNDRRPYAKVIDELIAAGNQGAMLVKLADTLDNLNVHRMAKVRASDPQKAERLTKKYEHAVEKLSTALNIDPDICKTIAEKDIKMEEDFTGEKYFVFDGNPVKTIWDEGIIEEVYIKETNGALTRNDGLAFYIETEVSEKDAISKETFEKLSTNKGFGVQHSNME